MTQLLTFIVLIVHANYRFKLTGVWCKNSLSPIYWWKFSLNFSRNVCYIVFYKTVKDAAVKQDNEGGRQDVEDLNLRFTTMISASVSQCLCCTSLSYLFNLTFYMKLKCNIRATRRHNPACHPQFVSIRLKTQSSTRRL